jgi:hypothetical protein
LILRRRSTHTLEPGQQGLLGQRRAGIAETDLDLLGDLAMLGQVAAEDLFGAPKKDAHRVDLLHRTGERTVLGGQAGDLITDTGVVDRLNDHTGQLIPHQPGTR